MHSQNNAIDFDFDSGVGKLEKLYSRIQKRICVNFGPPEVAVAMQFNGNSALPVHRWFHYKEGFSANILSVLGIDTDALSRKDAVFLDPFCGVGTTLLSGDLQQNWPATRVGIEVNPFVHFVAKTKVNWRGYDPERLISLANNILARPLCENIDETSWPELSTFHNDEMFLPSRVSALVDARNRIEEIKEPEKDLLLLGLATIAEMVGFYRKDGRALRIIRKGQKYEQKKKLRVEEALNEVWHDYADDLRLLGSQKGIIPGTCEIILGDGRTFPNMDKLGIRSGDVDLFAYSPPYLNHIDYTEVYKVELWLLGFISNYEEMRKQREQTLRSHASIKIASDSKGLPKDVINAVELASELVSKTGKDWHKYFRDTALGYFQDIRKSLKKQFKLSKPGGEIVCVVANSSHGSKHHRVPVAIDLLISILAKQQGFEVRELIIARQTHRRDGTNPYLRETAIVLRKPERVVS